jgi:hypothetical protein
MYQSGGCNGPAAVLQNTRTEATWRCAISQSAADLEPATLIIRRVLAPVVRGPPGACAGPFKKKNLEQDGGSAWNQ